jgi:endonuclease/exonuclease/phosphatase family metal-dependent hydrolase
LVPYLVRAEVIEDGEFASLSDHNPILIELA